MARDTVNVKNSIALLARIFDFLNQLDEEQVNDLIDGKVELKLDVQMDQQLDALIDKKLNSKLNSLIDGKLSGRSAAALPADDNANYSDAKKRGRPKKGSDANQDKLPRKVKSKEVKAGGASTRNPAVSNNSDVLEAVAAEVRSLSSRELIAEYFEKNPLKISIMKGLANKHFGISDTRKMNTESLINGIIESIMEPEPSDEADR